MKTSTLDRNGISVDLVDLVSRLVDLLRQNYQLRTVAKTKVQKKQQKPTPSLKTSGR